jgi:hypothetical protein
MSPKLAFRTEITIVPATVNKIIPDGTPEEEWKWVVDALRENPFGFPAIPRRRFGRRAILITRDGGSARRWRRVRRTGRFPQC